jgi:hypothetical protein
MAMHALFRVTLCFNPRRKLEAAYHKTGMACFSVYDDGCMEEDGVEILANVTDWLTSMACFQNVAGRSRRRSPFLVATTNRQHSHQIQHCLWHTVAHSVSLESARPRGSPVSKSGGEASPPSYPLPRRRADS